MAAVKEIYHMDSVRVIPHSQKFSTIIVAVNHTAFATVQYAYLLQKSGVLFDVKGFLKNDLVDERL